ncbi:MAG: iron-containing alcohol dehydrogenase [Psychrobacter sp.]|nr:iron-containing alcohol dehydrogenase [Psychrobacter sp.]
MITQAIRQKALPLIPDNIRHSSYLGVAKTRAKIMGVASKVLPMPRPLLLTGAEASIELCELIVSTNFSPILIVTDKILVGLGVLDIITDCFDAHQVTYHIYDGVTPDPTFAVVNEGLAISKKANCEAILAVGGGSVIDAAKMIAMSQGSNRSPKKLTGMLKGRHCLPLYAIPTTAGTGSEATIGAVVSDDKTHQKSIAINPKMVPIAAAIDPNIMKGMPPRITAETGIDVLTHAIEAWMSNTASTDTDFYAASAVKAVLDHLLTAYKDGDDLVAREAIGVAAHYGGIALNKAGLGYVHAIAHQLGAYHQIPHGRANAIVLPYILELNAEVSEKRLAALAKKIGAVQDKNASDRKIAEQLIQQIKDLLVDLNIDTSVPNMDKANFAEMARGAAREVSDTYAVPKYMTSDEVQDILGRIKTASDEAISKAAKDKKGNDKSSAA